MWHTSITFTCKCFKFKHQKVIDTQLENTNYIPLRLHVAILHLILYYGKLFEMCCILMCVYLNTNIIVYNNIFRIFRLYITIRSSAPPLLLVQSRELWCRNELYQFSYNKFWILYRYRFGSASSQASQSSGDICRICHCESDPQNPLLTPCYCSGSLKYVHQACLQQWLTASETNSCELCKFPFIMHTKIKPFNEVSILTLPN